MHFQMKIQPINNPSYDESVNCETPPAVKPVLKSRLKRLFDRQFPSVLKNNSEHSETVNNGEVKNGEQFEPSSVCLAKMVQMFIEDVATPEKPKCGRNRCNCFNGNINDSSDDEFNLFADSDASETLKSLTPCVSVIQRNLLADTSKIVDNNKNLKRKDELRKLVVEELISIGYDASICKSHWEKSSSYPAGEYEYLDVVVEGGDRIIIDLDFRSEFEIARPTCIYKAILRSLPDIFVGDAERLQQILAIVSESAKQSLKKKGMHVPPWRKLDYMRSKWLSTHFRTQPAPLVKLSPPPPTPPPTPHAVERKDTECGSFELNFGEETTSLIQLSLPEKKSDEGFELSPAGEWQPPALKPRSKLVVTGLGSLFREKV
ncbi:hypothetical protein HanOQP8_Chr13g0504161 [Helianthus annuus]|nr:hypothetical protein HanOQP8_Chr13g0504161 [Helianthus annuus]KAJ0851381.1 hypothetical protein HanPSC8_Chr13g0591521 [Helianthus annuus]